MIHTSLLSAGTSCWVVPRTLDPVQNKRDPLIQFQICNLSLKATFPSVLLSRFPLTIILWTSPAKIQTGEWLYKDRGPPLPRTRSVLELPWPIDMPRLIERKGQGAQLPLRYCSSWANRESLWSIFCRASLSFFPRHGSILKSPSVGLS